MQRATLSSTSIFLHVLFVCGGCILSSRAFFLPSRATEDHTTMSALSSVSAEPKLLVSHFHQISSTSGPDAKIRLVLASQSPRRTEILQMMGLGGRFTATPSPLDEEKLQIELSKQQLSPSDYARTLAERKAHAYGVEAADFSTDWSVTLIIGCDTIVDLNGKIMEKPSNEDVAYTMLSSLSDNWHQVHTGVAVYAVESSRSDNEPRLMFSFTDTARVKFCALTDRDIKAYIDTKEPFDKAGSYGIQGIGGQLVERIEGDFFTVMGLPMHRLSRELTETLKCLEL